MPPWNKKDVEDFVNGKLAERGFKFRLELLSFLGDGWGSYQIRPFEPENPDYFKAQEYADQLLEEYGRRGLE